LAPGENGEICLRGPKVTPATGKDPAKTAAAFFRRLVPQRAMSAILDGDGFLYPHRPQEGHDHLGGENIASSDSRTCHLRTAAGARSSRHRHARRTLGERPVAVIVLADSATLNCPT